MDQRIITSYTTFKFKDNFWTLDSSKRKEIIENLHQAITSHIEMSSFYQVFPARMEYDFFVWTTEKCETLEKPNQYFERYAKLLTPFRQYIDTPNILCGITKPTIYSRSKSKQEIDPFEGERSNYFVIYPFAKTTAWYLKSREERQQMMNGHIKIGKNYSAIKQLLLYSFGIQDQEFIVAYEMEDLPMFSDLVQELRSTEARDYTLLDTPIITGTLRSVEQLSDIFGA